MPFIVSAVFRYVVVSKLMSLNLIAIFMKLFSSLNTTHSIFIDSAKASDTVPHQSIYLKVSQLNIDCNVIIWLAHFLANCHQPVSVDFFSFSAIFVEFGVPRASSLGASLFYNQGYHV